MTQAFGSTGPLDWTATEERLERIRLKLDDLRGEADPATAELIRSILADETRDVERRRDHASTQLMEAFRLHQSRAAFSCLYELNAAHLYQQVASRLRRYRCRADALDVLQEVFFNVYRYPHRFNSEREDAFRVWTATIVRNTVLKHMRSLSRSGRAEVALDDLSEPKDDNTAEPVRGAIDNESTQECTRVFLNYLYLYLRFYRMLSEREQRAIRMVEVDGLSYRDAARELGIKLENLKMVIFRARRKIHRSMRRVFEGLPPDLRPAREPVKPARRASSIGHAGGESKEDVEKEDVVNEWVATEVKAMNPQGTKWWVDDLADECVQFQLDLSCLVDDELDEVAGAHAITHIEGCEACRTFFDDARAQVRAHRELADPEGLLARYATLMGRNAGSPEVEGLVQRLATIFYQLGKAYVLAGADPGFRTRVFEKAAQVASLKTRGRGFVDGVMASGRDETGGVDWAEARHLLNGRLERIESPLEKGRRLLEEALASDPSHEEARLYLAWLDAHEGKRIRAATSFRQIFRSSTSDENRAHAAGQLGRLLAEEGELGKAIACNRWILSSGLADRDERFFFAGFNVGLYYADLRRPERALQAFRRLLDRHPDRVGEIARLFLRSPKTRAVIDNQPGFAQALFEACPELFESVPGSTDVTSMDDDEVTQ